MVDTIMERLFDIIGGIFNIIWSLLCSIIYGLIVVMFNIFNGISQIDFLSSEQISGIYQRITMIITIVMVFYITFAFVKYVVSPDTITDKEKGAGNIVMRIITSILLIAFIPTIFSFGYKLQGRILDTNVIPKVIFGQEDWDYKTAGNMFAGNVFKAFYRVNYSHCDTEQQCEKAQEKVDSVIQSWQNDYGIWALGKANAYEIIDIDNTIQFDGLLAVIFGCFILYVLFSYNLDLATRYVQLTFLQIMAPVAAISNIAPQKDGMLKKWSKQCLTTYLDLFIRIAILYFMVLIVSIYCESFDFYEMSRNGEQLNIFLYNIVIAGILIFVQRVPKLLKELLPSTDGAASIGFGFKAKDRIDPIMKPVAATVGAVAGVASAAASLKRGALKEALNGKNFKGLNGAVSIAKAGFKGATSGVKDGSIRKAMATGRKSHQADAATARAGGSILGRTFLGGRFQNIKAKLDLDIKAIEAKVKINEGQAALSKSVKSGQDSSEDRSKKKIESKEQKMMIKGEDLASLVSEIKAPSTLGINIRAGQSTSEVYSMFEAATSSKKAAADAINQTLANAEANGTATDELRQLAAQKAQEAVEASDAQARAIKQLERYGITRTLQSITLGTEFDETIGEKEDAVLSTNLRTALQAIENVKNNPDEKLKNYLKTKLNSTEYAKYEDGKIDSFDLLDKIQSALTNYAATLGDESSALKEQIRNTKESDEYSAAEANASENK